MKSTHPSLAKLTPPRLPKIIDRTRLYRRLDQARKQRPILWITGPPGMGKTTLVASYLRARKLKPLWYQLDAGDGDLATFFHYLGLATQQAAPRYKQPLPHLTPEYVQGLPIFTRRYFETLYSRLKPPSVLVFDNYQEVPGDSGLHQMLTIGVETLLPGQTVVVVSRENPPTAYARLQATQLMDHLTHEELRLTSTETMGIVGLRQWDKVTRPSPAAIEELQTKLDGWVAGLVLVLEQTNTGKQLKALLQGQTPQVVFEYLATEVFDQLEPAVQEFLMQTAVLPWTTSGIAQALTGREDAEEILSNLFHRRYFTERREDAMPVYQFHPLFKEFLQARGKTKWSGQKFIQVHIKAAALLEESKRTDEAVELYRHAGDVEQVVRLILRHAPTWVAQGRGQMVDARIHWVPRETREEMPWLLFWQGCALFGVNIPKAQTLFESALEKFESQKDYVGFGLAWSCLVQAILYGWEDLRPLDGMLTQYEKVLPENFQYPDPNIESQVTFAMFSALLWRDPEYHKMQLWEKRAIQLLGKTNDPNQLAGQAVALTTYYQWMGRLADIKDVLTRVRNLVSSQSAGPFFRAMLLFIEAHYQWMMGDGSQCIQLAQKIETLAEESRMVGGLLVSNRAAKVLGALSDGDVPQAEHYLEENARHIKDMSLMTKGFHHFQLGWVNYLKGNYPRAKANVELAIVGNMDYAGPFPASQHYIGACYANQALGNTDQAKEQIAKAMTIGEQMESPLVKLMAGFAKAYVAFQEGSHEEGLVILQDAMEIGRKFGIIKFAWFLPQVIGQLCVIALENNIEVEYAKELIRKQHLPVPHPPLKISNWPWPVKIWTLDTFTIQVHDTPLAFTHKVPRKPLELLKAIMAFGGHDVSEERLIDALWPEAEGDKGKDVLLKTITRLRKILGVEGVLQHRDGKVSLDAHQCWVDVWAFEALMGQGQQDTSGDDALAHPEKLEHALALYCQSFLAHDEASWSHAQRERLRTKYTQGVVSLSRHWVAQQEWKKAETWLERGLAIEPTTEALYQELIAGLMHQGRQAEAAQVYERCRKEFTTTLGIDPSAKTQRLLSPKSKE